MTYRNKYDYRGCAQMDQEATASFLSLAEEKGWTIVKARGREDFEEHWDWKIGKNGIDYKVDLKSLKRINSKDATATDQLMLIELQAVKSITSDKRKGWLYGIADYICFEVVDGFMFVPREHLKEYVESHIDISLEPVLSNQNKKVHTIYTRKDRADKFIYLYKSEIIQLATAIWRKHA